MDSPYWKGPLPGVDVQRRYLWKTFRGKPNSIPGSARKCSASALNPVRLHPGMLFGFSPESCSTCPGMLFGLPRNTHTINGMRGFFPISAACVKCPPPPDRSPSLDLRFREKRLPGEPLLRRQAQTLKSPPNSAFYRFSLRADNSLLDRLRRAL